MAANYPNYQINQQPTQMSPQSFPQVSNLPSFFPQPIGNVYNLNTANDIGNIPAGTGVSIGLCLQEGVMYVKSLQNGAPMLLEYKLNANDVSRTPETSSAAAEELKKIASSFKTFEEKFTALESEIGKIKEKMGGKLEWQI